MTVNELIKRLEELDPNAELRFSDNFGKIYSSDFDIFSWRGSYNYPAIKVSEQKYTVKEALKNLKSAEGRILQGYKGGEYLLDMDLDVFLVANYKASGDAVTISEILDDGFCFLINDAY